MMMQKILRSFLPALVCLVAAGLALPADAHAPLDEIREVLRTQLYPPADETTLQALSWDNLAQKLKQLDPYAGYFTAEQAAGLLAEQAPRTGVGAQLFARKGSMLLSPYPGGALDQAGIIERCVLLAINGQAVQDRTLSEAAAMLHGQPGSLIRLRIRPLSSASAQTVTVVRSSFRPPDVELIQTAGRTVLRIRDFVAGQTRSALKASIEFLDIPDGPLIIDLRESGGGDLFEALDCAGLFVAQGKSLGGLETRDSGRTLVSSPPGDKVSGPVILLVGPDTASAAEVFAAALQRNESALLIGRPTYGKCTTQTEITLSDGAILRVTNGYVLAPEGRSCAADGLKPDLYIPESDLYDMDYMVDQALIAGRD
jgi:carboxyl-terminal processing protease